MKGAAEVAEHARKFVRRSVAAGVVGFGSLAAAALMGLGTGIAAADEISADPAAPSAGPAVEGGIRTPAIQGELRAVDQLDILAQGEVNGANSRIVGKAVPPRITPPNTYIGYGPFSNSADFGPFSPWG